MKVNVNGIALHVSQYGAGTPALVFLHYWGGSSGTWRYVIEALSHQFRTVALDQRGWGKSEAPESDYALADMANDVQAVIDKLDLKHYVLVGHSMGGKVAQCVASRQPPGLMGLALIAPAVPGPLALPLAVRTGMTHAYDSRESIIATVEQVLAPDGLDPDDLACVIADSLAGAAAAKQSWPLVTSQEDISADLHQIHVPVVVVSGEHDRVDPPDVLRSELLSRIPQAHMHVLPNVGHLLPLEAPREVAALIRHFALSLVL